MSVIEPGSSESFSIDNEKPIILKSNKPIKFLIETEMGSIIKGILIPNNPIEIISKGDISKAELTIDENSTKELFLIK